MLCVELHVIATITAEECPCVAMQSVFSSRDCILLHRVADSIRHCKLYETVNDGKRIVLANPLTLPVVFFEPTVSANYM